MKHKIAMVLLLGVGTTNLYSTPCPQRTPNYVIEGGSGISGTEQAEALTCRDDTEYLGAVDQIDVIEDRILTSAQVRDLIKGGRVTFRHCRFKEALDVRHIGAATFENCDFEGAVRFNSVRGRSLTIRDSLFHQGFEITESRLTRGIVIVGSVFTSSVEINNSSFGEGFAMQNSRIRGSFEAAAMTTERCASFENVKFLSGLAFTQLEIRDCLSFKGCEWGRDARLAFAKGNVGTIRFDACDFDAPPLVPTEDDSPAQVRLSGVTVNSALLLASVASTRYPTLRIDRSVISHIKLPDWDLAAGMVLAGLDPTNTSDREALLETLGVVRASYEREGRQGDAFAVARQYRLVLSSFRGPLAHTMNVIRNATEDLIAYIFAFVVLVVAAVFWWLEERPLVSESRFAAIGRSLDASWTALFKGPRREEKYRNKRTVTVLRLARLTGAITLFYLFARIQELFNG